MVFAKMGFIISLLTTPAVQALQGVLDPNDSILEIGAQRYASVGLFSDEGRFFCSGVLINKNTILTAAHCITMAPAGSFSVVFFGLKYSDPKGNFETGTSGTRYSVKKPVIHPDFKLNVIGSPDLAVLRIKTFGAGGVIEKGTVVPIEILPANVQISNNFIFGVSGIGQNNYGWGLTRLASSALLGDISKRLREKQSIYQDYFASEFGPVESMEPLFESLSAEIGTGNVFFVREGMGDTAYSCPGDSGGPLIAKTDGGTFLIGIDSRRLNKVSPEVSPILKCHENNLHSYTNVRKFMPWIEQTMKSLDQAD